MEWKIEYQNKKKSDTQKFIDFLCTVLLYNNWSAPRSFYLCLFWWCPCTMLGEPLYSIQIKWKIYNLSEIYIHTPSIVLSLLYSCFAKKFVIRREAVKSIVCCTKWYEKHLSVFITAYKILCFGLYFEYTLYIAKQTLKH